MISSVGTRASWCLLALVTIGAGCAPFERGQRRAEADADAVVDAGSVDAGANGPSFKADVHPILLDRCGLCHRRGGAGASTKYVLADDAAADRDTVLALVDTDVPDASPLLAKARGEMHVGGSALPRSSADYALVHAWIAAGGPP